MESNRHILAERTSFSGIIECRSSMKAWISEFCCTWHAAMMWSIATAEALGTIGDRFELKLAARALPPMQRAQAPASLPTGRRHGSCSHRWIQNVIGLTTELLPPKQASRPAKRETADKPDSYENLPGFGTKSVLFFQLVQSSWDSEEAFIGDCHSSIRYSDRESPFIRHSAIPGSFFFAARRKNGALTIGQPMK